MREEDKLIFGGIITVVSCIIFTIISTILIEKKGAPESRSQSGKSSNNLHNQKGYANFINNVYNSYANKLGVGEDGDNK